MLKKFMLFFRSLSVEAGRVTNIGFSAVVVAVIQSFYMRGLYSHSREYRKICLRNHSPHIGQILEGIHFGGNTPTRIQENIPGELFMYWFRARGYCYADFYNSQALE